MTTQPNDTQTANDTQPEGPDCFPVPESTDWQDVRPWRKRMREILIEKRKTLSPDRHAEIRDIVTAKLIGKFSLDGEPGAISSIGFYWPFRLEIDFRPFMRQLHAKGYRLALPVVVEKNAPVVFRRWSPGCKMEHGIWNIPVPAEGEAMHPDLLVIPLVGYDSNNYRLGYGGGYYDRTLASSDTWKPIKAGVGFAFTCTESIYPQTHDIPMNYVFTESNL